MGRPLSILPVVFVLVCTVPAAGQFRRGILGDSTEISLAPIVPPALLLPAGSVEVQVQNTSTAPARVVARVRDLLGRQLTDNDSRLSVAETAADFVIAATLTEWTESRRNSTKYVSERRQVGTREVTDKNGKKRTEAVYESGHNEPSVVISGAAGIRIEVRRRAGGSAIADETARHTIQAEHLARDGPPRREEVEDTLLDQVVRKAAGRVSPGRERVRLLLARSDEVDRLNALAQERRWQEWLTALEALKPHRDRKRDSSRLHNLAVANEAMAYEASALEEQSARLGLATQLIAQARQLHPDEKYIVESQSRIQKSTTGYGHLAELYQQAKTMPVAPPTSQRISAPAAPPPPPPASAALTNQDVIDLRAAGIDDDNLIAAIKAAKAVNFDLSPAGLKALLTAKVSNRVIAAMRTVN